MLRQIKFFFNANKSDFDGNIRAVLYIENNQIKQIRYFDFLGKEIEDTQFVIQNETKYRTPNILEGEKILYKIIGWKENFQDTLVFTPSLLSQHKLWSVFDKKYELNKLEEKYKKVRKEVCGKFLWTVNYNYLKMKENI